MYRPRVDKSVGVFQEIINRFREQDKQRGLVHLPNKKTPYINVVNIVAAAHDDSFEKYLKEHGLPTPGITMTGDWRDHHDCVYLRTHGFLNQKGFGTLLKYIGIAQLADYIDHVPNREPEVNWRELTITDAILLFRRLCREVGVKPRNFGPFVHAICRATLGQRRNLALFGGRKLMAPPPWCRFKQQWDEVLAEERQKHYKQQARRQGRAADESEGLPAYGYRTAKNRAPRRKKRAAADEEQSSEHSSEQNPFDWPSDDDSSESSAPEVIQSPMTIPPTPKHLATGVLIIPERTPAYMRSLRLMNRAAAAAPPAPSAPTAPAAPLTPPSLVPYSDDDSIE